MIMIYKRVKGMIEENCYIIGDNGEGVIIDPGAKAGKIMDGVEKTGLKIKYIILTHAHLDHMLSMEALRKESGAEVILHESEAGYLNDPRYNGAQLFGMNTAFKEADRLVNHGDVLSAGGLELSIIHTPGHTPGGICIKVGKSLFTGDTLFRMSIGRTDLGTGSHKDIINSIKKKIMKLDDDVIIYPGHGASSTVGYERKNNPHI